MCRRQASPASASQVGCEVGSLGSHFAARLNLVALADVRRGLEQGVLAGGQHFGLVLEFRFKPVGLEA